jgi:hypothetical protein
VDRETRFCPRCETDRALGDYYFTKDETVSGYCKDCDKARVIKRQIDNKLRAVVYKGGSCQICGYSKCLSAMDFHHVEPGLKEFEISTSKRSFEQNKAELDKCVLLCCRCHREVEDGITECPGK